MQEQQFSQSGCIRMLGFLLVGLGIIAGLIVFASFGRMLGGSNNDSQKPTTIDDVQQYVFGTMAKPVQDYRLKHPTYGRSLGIGQIVVEYSDDRPSMPSPQRSSPVRTVGTWIKIAIMSSVNSTMPGDLSRSPCNVCKPVENWIKPRRFISLSLPR